jgi:hypothetical protein
VAPWNGAVARSNASSAEADIWESTGSRGAVGLARGGVRHDQVTPLIFAADAIERLMRQVFDMPLMGYDRYCRRVSSCADMGCAPNGERKGWELSCSKARKPWRTYRSQPGGHMTPKSATKQFEQKYTRSCGLECHSCCKHMHIDGKKEGWSTLIQPADT